MPNSPYAKLQVSVNGGAPASGGVTVPSAAAVQFSGESTVGWKRARFEVLDYPEGWATPAGWTLDGTNGKIYALVSGPFLPPAITLPASSSIWGKWYPRLLVNEQLDSSDVVIDQSSGASLFDDATVLSMLSPKGLHDISAREQGQFTTSTTRIKGWIADVQRTLRVIEAQLGGGGGGSGETNTTSNVGGGPGQIAAAKSGVNLPMRTLDGTGGIVVTTDGNKVIIDGSAIEGGGGAVTFSGDVEGDDDSQTVVGIQGIPVVLGDGPPADGARFKYTSAGGGRAFFDSDDVGDGSGEANTASNLITAGAGQVVWWNDKSGVDLRFYGFAFAPYFDVSTDTVKQYLTLKGLASAPAAGQSIRYNAGATGWEVFTPSSGGEANTMSSLGGTSLVGTKSGVDLPIKGISAGNNVSIGNNSTNLTLNAVPSGSDTQVAFNDGGSTFGADAGLTYNKTTDVLSVAGAIASGSIPASAGYFRAATGAAFKIRNFANSGDMDGFTNDSSNNLLIGASGAASIDLFSGRLNVTANQITCSPSGTTAMKISASLVQFTKPRVGDSTPYGSDGGVNITLSSSPYTLVAAEYSRSYVECAASTPFRTIIMPHASTLDAVYFKWISATTGGTFDTLTVSTGTGATKTLAAGKAGLFMFAPAGVLKILESTPV